MDDQTLGPRPATPAGVTAADLRAWREHHRYSRDALRPFAATRAIFDWEHGVTPAPHLYRVVVWTAWESGLTDDIPRKPAPDPARESKRADWRRWKQRQQRTEQEKRTPPEESLQAALDAGCKPA